MILQKKTLDHVAATKAVTGGEEIDAQKAEIEKSDPCHLKDHSDVAEPLQIRQAERKLFVIISNKALLLFFFSKNNSG